MGALDGLARELQPLPARLVLYVAHPLGAPDRAGLDANMRRAMRWLSWLRRSFPETTFIAPWIAAVLAGADDSSEAEREAGLIDDCAVVARCDGLVLCGGRVSSGMARESAAARRCWDLTTLGEEPPRVAADGSWFANGTQYEDVVVFCGVHGLDEWRPSAVDGDSAPAGRRQQEPSNRRDEVAAAGFAPDGECAADRHRHPIPGETWCSRSTQATAEIVECDDFDGWVSYRRSEPGFPHVGQPWRTPLALFLDAFAPPDGHRDVKPENVIPAGAADPAFAAEVPQDASNCRNEAAAKSAAPATGAEILRRFDVAEVSRPCCRRIGEGWCYLEALHDGMCITATQRPLPVSNFGPTAATSIRRGNTGGRT